MSGAVAEDVGRAPIVPLSEVADLVRGVSYPKADAREEPAPGFVPVLRATNIQGARLVLDSDLVYVAERNVSSDQLLCDGDIVVATSSGSKHLVGKSGQLHASWQGSFGAFCATIRPRPGIHARYLALFLQAPAYWRQITKKALGVNINNLRRGDLESLELPLPPLNVQEGIVAELEKQLSRLDGAVANLKRVRANLKRYKAAILRAAVEGRLVPTEAELARREDRGYETGAALLKRLLHERRAEWRGKGQYVEPPGAQKAASGLPEGWAWACVAQLNPVHRPCAYGVLQPREYVAGGVPFVRVGDIDDGHVQVQGIKAIAATIAADYPRTRLHGGEVLITLVGAIGRTTVVPASLAGANVARAVGVIPLMPELNPSWVEIWFRNPSKVAEMNGKAHEVARKTLNLEDVRSAEVALPPLVEQERIVAEVDRRLSLLAETEHQVHCNLSRAHVNRASLLSKAFGSA